MAKKKALPDPIETTARDLKKLLKAKSSDLEDLYKKEKDEDKKEILKLELCVIHDLVDDLDKHVLNRPFTIQSFLCP